MIIVTVKSSYQGRVALRDKYIKEAERTGEGIMISFGNEYMEMPAWKIPMLIKARSPLSFKDRFSRERHYLVYFDWIPTGKQRRLFTLAGVGNER